MPPLDLYATPDASSPFGATVCGEVRASAAGAHTRVSQAVHGIELTGWMSGTLDDIDRGPMRCTLREVRREDCFRELAP
jgi:hypothetical protein